MEPDVQLVGMVGGDEQISEKHRDQNSLPFAVYFSHALSDRHEDLLAVDEHIVSYGITDLLYIAGICLNAKHTAIISQSRFFDKALQCAAKTAKIFL